MSVDGRATRRALNPELDYYSLEAAEALGLAGVSRLPCSLKVVLENVLRQHAEGRSGGADIAAVAEVGKTYLGKVVRIADFGAFVEIFPGTDGLLHISEISESRIKNVRDELNEGDQILVKVLALEGNKIKLSRKAILKEQREKLKTGAEKAE